MAIFIYVSRVGLEPTTLCLRGRCSNQLSYRPVCLIFSNYFLLFLCPGEELNLHGENPQPPQDCASTSFATWALYLQVLLKIKVKLIKA